MLSILSRCALLAQTTRVETHIRKNKLFVVNGDSQVTRTYSAAVLVEQSPAWSDEAADVGTGEEDLAGPRGRKHRDLSAVETLEHVHLVFGKCGLISLYEFVFDTAAHS